MNSKKNKLPSILITVLLFTFLFYSFGKEWFWQSTGSPYRLTLISLFLPPLMLLVMAAILQAFKNNSLFGRLSFAAFLFFMCIAASIILPSPYKGRIGIDFYLMLFAVYISILLGYKIGYSSLSLDTLLYRSAAFLGLLGYFSFFYTLMPSTSGLVAYNILSIGWPMRLIEMFSLFYFLHRFLYLKDRNIFSIICFIGALLACILLFTKNIILPVIVGILIYFVILLFWSEKQRRAAILFRIISSLLVIVFLFFVIDNLSKGSYSSKINEEFYGHIIKSENISKIDLETATSSRTTLWKDIIPRFSYSPIFGNGFGQSIRIGVVGETIPLHNGFLDLLVSVGLLGFSIFLFAIIDWFKIVGNKRVFIHSNGYNLAILAYVIATLAFNLGSTSRLFYATSCFSFFLMALIYGYAKSLNRALIR